VKPSMGRIINQAHYRLFLEEAFRFEEEAFQFAEEAFQFVEEAVPQTQFGKTFLKNGIIF